MGAEVHSIFKQKIHFLIQKEVPFGKALYVVGEIQQLGTWEVAKSLRLSWNRDHYWTGFIELPTNFNLKSIQFRYAICDWSNPSKQNTIWEAGPTNRIIQLQSSSQHTICDNSWNMDRITVNLIVPEQFQQHEYFIAGDCPELGSWRKRIKLTPSKTRIHSSLVNLVSSKDDKKYLLYSHTFQVFREKPKINYCYVRKYKSETEVERLPSRQYSLSSRTNNHPKCLKVLSLNGNISILQRGCFQELNYSVISENILLGPYLQGSEDFALLRQKGVTAILSLQTQEDLEMHKLNIDYLVEKSEKNNIKHYHFSIEDANKKDFLEKFRAPTEMLCELIKRGEVVYVHCSAGIHRSPQIVAIFLALSEKFSVDQAIEYVRSRHPFARPSQELVSQALNILSSRALAPC